MGNEFRKDFYKNLGEYYRKYGYPKICGYIEGLMTLNANYKWSQKELSETLKKIFPEEPASISSVNRAIRILEGFGVVEKEGSRKIGYTYTISSSGSYLVKMFEFFLESNREYINSLESISKSMQKGRDEALEEALIAHISACKILEQEYRKTLNSLKSFFTKKDV
ncbi:MAG: hypothetical protein ACTSPG_05795 [Candidatus Hodarchaeales archaeon]